MNKKILTTLLISFSLLGFANSSFATENKSSDEILQTPLNLDVEDTSATPKDSSQYFEEVVDKELSAEMMTVQEEEKSAQEIIDKAEAKEKQDKNKKFFTRAQREEKSNKNSQKETADAEQPATEVIVDSETIEYFPERHEFEAVGNAKVSFPSENSVLHADKIVFNHDTNHVKGYGNIVLIKDGQKINGEYIQVDLNENNAMMTKPVLNHLAIKIRAKQGIVSETQTEALDGIVTFNDKTTYKFISRPVFGFHEPMIDEAVPKYFYFKEKYDNKWRLKAKTIIIDSYKDRDVATFQNADLYAQDVKIGSAGKIKLFTDKEQQYIETNLLDLGAMRNFGAYVSPGYVFQTPNASTLRLGPALTYGDGLGVGAMGRFFTDKNHTAFGWSSSKSKIVMKGEQKFTDNLRLQYGVNTYLNNFFMGSRLPKYGVQLVHQKGYDLEDLGIRFTNRFAGGYYMDKPGHDYSTFKATWQTESKKSLFKYKHEERKFAMDAGLNVQTHAAMYGTGDTMGVVNVGPYLKTQYRSWQQHLGYFVGGQAGESPMYFDRNYYGKNSVVLGESIRISKYLTLMYAMRMVLSDDVPFNGTKLQENRFYALIGPDDLKFMIGYDAYRQTATMGFSMNLGAENSDVEFRRLVLNDPEAIGKKEKSDKEKMAAQKRKAAEEKKKKESDPMNRSVKDYDDYNPEFNMMPGGAMLNPSFIRPPGM